MSKPRMTDEQVLDEMQKNTPLNKARQVFSSHRAKIENEGLQRTPLSPIAMRRMEFEAVLAIEDVLADGD